MSDLRAELHQDLARDREQPARGWRRRRDTDGGGRGDDGISWRLVILLMLATFAITSAVLHFGLPRLQLPTRGAAPPEAQGWIRAAAPARATDERRGWHPGDAGAPDGVAAEPATQGAPPPAAPAALPPPSSGGPPAP